MLKRIWKTTVSAVLVICLLVPMFAVTSIGAAEQPESGVFFSKIRDELAATGSFIAEKAKDKAYDIGMRAISCGLDALADATGESGKSEWTEAISFVNDWVFKDASEVAIAEVEELCREILGELSEIETQIEDSISILGSVLSQSIIKSANDAVDNKWQDYVMAPIESKGANSAFIDYKQYVTDAIDGKKSKTEMQAELDHLIDDFYLMYEGQSGLGLDHRELMFASDSVNKKFTDMIGLLAANLNKNDSVTQKAVYFAYVAYPFSHQQYSYVYSMMEKQLVYLILVEMMYNEFLFQQGEYLKNSPNYGVDSAAYGDYLQYQQDFFNLMTENDGCVNEQIGVMLETKVTVDRTNGVSLSLEDYMKPEDVVSVPMTIQDYESSHDFWDEADEEANLYKGEWSDKNTGYVSKADKIKKTVWFKRVMTHSSYGSKVFYIIDPDKVEDGALNVRNFKNKISIVL